MASSSAFADGFNSVGFISAIKETMKMGIPEDENERLTFHWKSTETFPPLSPAGNSYSWDQEDPGEPTPGVPEDSVQVDYALEIGGPNSTNTLLGTIEENTAVVTMLDEDYELIKTADYCTIGTSEYQILFQYPVIGLFDVGVHQLLIKARDEA